MFSPNTLIILSRQFSLGIWTRAFVVQDWVKVTCRFQVLFDNFLFLVTISFQTARKPILEQHRQNFIGSMNSVKAKPSMPLMSTLKHAHKFNYDYSKEVLLVLAGLGPQNCQTAAFSPPPPPPTSIWIFMNDIVCVCVFLYFCCSVFDLGILGFCPA